MSHSAWNPYAILPTSLRHRIDQKLSIPSHSFIAASELPEQVVGDRLSGKYLQLDAPVGKTSEWREMQVEKRAGEKRKRDHRSCGLVGRRQRHRLSKDEEGQVRYEAVLAIHHLWLGYMIEITGLPILLPSSTSSTPPSLIENSTVSLLPMYPPKDALIPSDLKLNTLSLHAKLVKAEFVGCLISVKRAKNPSLVGLKGIILQETQSVFKIITILSSIKILPKKNSIFTFSLPLSRPSSSSSSSSALSTEAIESREINFDIYGDSFQFRSAERVNKKWKVGNGNGGISISSS